MGLYWLENWRAYYIKFLDDIDYECHIWQHITLLGLSSFLQAPRKIWNEHHVTDDSTEWKEQLGRKASGKCFEGIDIKFQLWWLHTEQVGIVYVWVPTAELILRSATIWCILYRKQLEETLQFYEIHVHKPEHGPKSPVVAEALCKLTYLYVKLREQDIEEDYLERSLQELKENFSEGISPDPSVSWACTLHIGYHASNNIRNTCLLI